MHICIYTGIIKFIKIKNNRLIINNRNIIQKKIIKYSISRIFLIFNDTNLNKGWGIVR